MCSAAAAASDRKCIPAASPMFSGAGEEAAVAEEEEGDALMRIWRTSGSQDTSETPEENERKEERLFKIFMLSTEVRRTAEKGIVMKTALDRQKPSRKGTTNPAKEKASRLSEYGTYIT